MAITGADVREQELRRRFERSRIPDRYRGMTLDLLEENDGNKKAIAAVQQYMIDLEQHPRSAQGLLFAGPPGRGKTTLACIVGQWVINHGGRCYYTSVAQWQKTMLRSFRDDETADEAIARLDLIENVRFLILDDVGKEHTTQSRHVEDELDALLRMRYDAARPTIMTTNVVLGDWKVRYSLAMESFLHEAFTIVGVGGPDWRKRSRGEG